MKLPGEVRQRLAALEWDNRKHLSARLLGIREWPIRVALGAPSGTAAVKNLVGFREFVLAWKGDDVAKWVETETRTLRELQQQSVPTHFVLETPEDLAAFLGPKAQAEWAVLRDGLESVDAGWVQTWSRFSKDLIDLPKPVVRSISDAVVQLRGLRGSAEYLRSLPLEGVGTKLVEEHFGLIERLVDTHYEGEVTAAGGLLGWLRVQRTPKDWLLVRPLSASVQERFHGARTLRMGWQALADLHWPALTLFVVENETSVYALPEIPDGVAVAGTGGNIGWLASAGSRFFRVVYWGDIDYDGLRLLARAREMVPSVVPMLTDCATYRKFLDRSTRDNTAHAHPIRSEFLTPGEQELLRALEASDGWRRLEQEKLPGKSVTEAALAKSGLRPLGYTTGTGEI